MRVGEYSYLLTRVSSMAYDSLQEFQQLRSTHSRIPRIARLVHWCPPPPRLVKVNFDGAFFSRENIDGLGLIIRNDQRLVMAILSQQIPLPASVEIVEVLAARQTLLFAQELGFESLVMEGDSKIIINAIKGDNINLSDYSYLREIIVYSRSTINAYSLLSHK